jgi:hypothetical protein
MLHWLYMYVANICFKCFICFRRMLYVFYMYVSYVAMAVHVCCKCMFYLFQTYVTMFYLDVAYSLRHKNKCHF